MKKTTLIMIIVMLCIVMILPTHAAIKKVAQTGFQFLKIEMSARAAAMGGSFMMIGTDADAMFYNPAGIAHMDHKYDVFVSQTEWFADMGYKAGALAVDLGNIGTVGASFVTGDYGTFYGTRLSDNTAGYVDTEELTVGAYAVGVGFARRLTDKFSVGGQIKYAYQHLGSSRMEDGSDVVNELSSLAYDFGTIFYPGYKSLRVGMSIRNFSPQIKYEVESFEMPLTFTIGTAMDILDILGEDHENALLLSVDAIHPRDYTERLHVGGEFLFMDMVAIRAGYKTNYDVEGLTLGAGIDYVLSGINVRIDYAYSLMEYFDAVNRFSISLGM
jgi:hypothetical protein